MYVYMGGKEGGREARGEGGKGRGRQGQREEGRNRGREEGL